MISVIVPIFNAGKYLSRTIACLQNQLYADFEVLLVNDGSTDDSAIICEEAARADLRFRYIVQENQGVSAARNHGMAQSNGEYITFIDADDSIPENYLEELHHALVSSNSQMAVCDVAVVDDRQETIRFSLMPQLLTQQETLNYVLTRKGINSGPYAKLFKREILSGLTFPALKAYEDILFVIDAVCRCDRVAVTNRTRYRYIQNSGSAMDFFMKTPSQDIVTASKELLEFTAARPELDPRCFYITVSHLMQYVLPLAGRPEPEAKAFVAAAKKLIEENKRNILHCSAFPWKEKMVYMSLTCGVLYHNKKLTRI